MINQFPLPPFKYELSILLLLNPRTLVNREFCEKFTIHKLDMAWF